MFKVNDVYWGGVENPRRWINNRGSRGNDYNDIGIISDLTQAIGYLKRRKFSAR